MSRFRRCTGINRFLNLWLRSREETKSELAKQIHQKCTSLAQTSQWLTSQCSTSCKTWWRFWSWMLPIHRPTSRISTLRWSPNTPVCSSGWIAWTKFQASENTMLLLNQLTFKNCMKLKIEFWLKLYLNFIEFNLIHLFLILIFYPHFLKNVLGEQRT